MNKQNKIRKSLIVSMWDGVFASCMSGFANDYIAPYALALRATSAQIGLLSAVSNFAASLGQLHSPVVTQHFKSRKKVFTLFVFLQACVGIPIILAPHLLTSKVVPFVIVCVALFLTFHAIATPAWSSLMSEYIPYKKRGVYFGWRNKILNTLVVICSFLAGLILYWFRGNVLQGFFIIFTVACACRFVSWYFLTRMYEPPYRNPEGAHFSFVDFIRRMKDSNFGRFVLFVSCVNFCVNLAAPFFSVFMLRDLNFSYLTFTILVTAVTAANIISIARWGRHADAFGNLKVIKFTALLIATLPLWWLINQHPFYLFLVQILGGFAWSGFLLCSNNFVYDAVTPEKRTRCIAYFNTCAGLATCIGALCGGYLATAMPTFLGYKLLSLFLFSSALRFIVIFLFAGKIKEVRSAKHISRRELLYSMIGVRSAIEE
ncbi:MAG: MFS transporter [Candidatus Omnitrophica bacterium]|nr:MFS transporter [Candidatus Omnitrophota bacterium]